MCILVHAIMKRLSLSRPPKAYNNKALLSAVKPEGVYKDVVQPPGITNSANNCYANAVFQCLMNSQTFLEMCNSLHHNSSCQECTAEGISFSFDKNIAVAIKGEHQCSCYRFSVYSSDSRTLVHKVCVWIKSY